MYRFYLTFEVALKHPVRDSWKISRNLDEWLEIFLKMKARQCCKKTLYSFVFQQVREYILYFLFCFLLFFLFLYLFKYEKRNILEKSVNV